MTEQTAATKKVKQITVPLSEPISWGEETISELVLKRPKAKDIEHLSADPTLKELLTVAQKCSRQPKRVIDDLDAEDAMAVVDAVADFLDGGQKTGNTRSF